MSKGLDMGTFVCQEMDLCKGGGDLKNVFLNENPALTFQAGKSRFLDNIAQITRCVAALHQLNIVHRDLKLQNMMCCQLKDGTFGIQVIDFGCSHLFNFPPILVQKWGTPCLIEWKYLQGYLNDFYAYIWIILFLADPKLYAYHLNFQYSFFNFPYNKKDLEDDEKINQLYKHRLEWTQTFFDPWYNALFKNETKWTCTNGGKKETNPITKEARILRDQWKNQTDFLLPKLVKVYLQIINQKVPSSDNTPGLIQSFLPEWEDASAHSF